MKMKKMEQEMEEVFEMKVVEKQQKLKDIEQDVCLSICLFVLYAHCIRYYEAVQSYSLIDVRRQ